MLAVFALQTVVDWLVHNVGRLVFINRVESSKEIEKTTSLLLSTGPITEDTIKPPVLGVQTCITEGCELLCVMPPASVEPEGLACCDFCKVDCDKDGSIFLMT